MASLFAGAYGFFNMYFANEPSDLGLSFVLGELPAAR